MSAPTSVTTKKETVEKRRRLLEIGFEFQPTRATFYKNLDGYLKWMSEHGGKRPSQYSNDEEEKRLGLFLKNQK